jgi:hypothetical protein
MTHRGHLRVVGRNERHEIPRSLAGRPSLPDQMAAVSGGLLGSALGLVVLIGCGLAQPVWKAWRRLRGKPAYE